MSDTSSDEQVLLVAHKHWASFFVDAVIIVVPGLVALLLLALFGLSSGGLDPMVRAAIALLLPSFLLAAWIMLAVVWTNHYLDMLIVTDRRIFYAEQVRLSQQMISEWSIDDVRRVDIQMGNFLESMLRYGSLRIEMQGGDGIVVRAVRDPEFVRAVILKQDEHIGTLQETARKQGELLKFVSHEVKGHLAKSKAAFAAIAEGDYGTVSAPLDSMVQAALADSQKGVDTVMAILEDTDQKRGELALNVARFDLADCVRRSVGEFLAPATHKGLALIFSSDGPCSVAGDEAKLYRHVVRNLLDNAIRYTPAGRIEVALAKTHSTVKLSISDTGVGMSESDKQRLFTQGGHGERSKEVNAESTGYGLFIAKQIVDAHGGRIWAESRGPGAGSRFFVELPLA